MRKVAVTRKKLKNTLVTTLYQKLMAKALEKSAKCPPEELTEEDIARLKTKLEKIKHPKNKNTRKRQLPPWINQRRGGSKKKKLGNEEQKAEQTVPNTIYDEEPIIRYEHVEPNYYVDPIPNVVPEGGIHYELAQSDNLYEHCIYISC